MYTTLQQHVPLYENQTAVVEYEAKQEHETDGSTKHTTKESER